MNKTFLALPLVFTLAACGNDNPSCSDSRVQKLTGDLLLGNFKKLDPPGAADLDKVQVNLSGITTDNTSKNSSSCTAILTFYQDGKKMEPDGTDLDPSNPFAQALSATPFVNHLQVQAFLRKQHTLHYKESRTDDGNLLVQTSQVID